MVNWLMLIIYVKYVKLPQHGKYAWVSPTASRYVSWYIHAIQHVICLSVRPLGWAQQISTLIKAALAKNFIRKILCLKVDKRLWFVIEYVILKHTQLILETLSCHWICNFKTNSTYFKNITFRIQQKTG